jgi:hypothetical protein
VLRNIFNIFWGKKNGQSNLNYFGYKNLIGRGGRMFKHFIGEIYLLEEPPKKKEMQLSLEMPKELIDESDISNNINDDAKRQAIVDFHVEMRNKLGINSYNKLKKQGFFLKEDILINSTNSRYGPIFAILNTLYKCLSHCIVLAVFK